MKSHIKTTMFAVVLVFLGISARCLQAQVVNVLTVTATLSVQSQNVTDNGTITTTGKPQKAAFTTKTLIADLIKAEFFEGNYSSKIAPSGAKLVAVGGFSSPDFQIWDAANDVLVDVSDILSSATGAYGTQLVSGTTNDNTGLANFGVTNQQIFVLTYDDTGANGTLQFNLVGLLISKTTDTAPNVTTGAYYETQTDTATNAVGDGNYKNSPMLITGKFSITGAAKLNINN